VFARADAPNAVIEPSETNNNRTASIRIGPDLIVSAMTAPATAGPARRSMNETTKNQGGSSAGASTTRYYLSASTCSMLATSRCEVAL
jgi:subtilase family serine protease